MMSGGYRLARITLDIAAHQAMLDVHRAWGDEGRGKMGRRKRRQGFGEGCGEEL